MLNPELYPIDSDLALVSEDIHGQKIRDSFRYLGKAWAFSENEACPKYNEFVDRQNQLSNEILGQYELLEQLQNCIIASQQYASLSNVSIVNGTYCFADKPNGVNGHYWQYQTLEDPKPTKLLDFDALQSQSSGLHGKSYESINLSPDGSMASLTFSEDGGDQTFGKIYRVSDQTLLGDHIQGIIWSSLDWTLDNKSVVYVAKLSLLSNPNVDPKGSKLGILLHKIGTEQCDDILLYQNLVKPQNYVTIGMLEDKLLRYEFNSETVGMTLAYCPLNSFDAGQSQKDIGWKFVNSDENISYSFIGQSGDVLYLYFKDESQCPNGKIMGYSYTTGSLEDVIDEAQNAVLNETKSALINKRLIATVRTIGLREVFDIYDIESKTWRNLIDWEIGSYATISGSSDSNELFFQVKTIFHPVRTYYLDIGDVKAKPIAFDPTSKSINVLKECDFETNLVWIESRDKTKIPMYIVSKNGIECTNETPLMIYAYGDHGVIVRPSYNEIFSGWLSHFSNPALAFVCCRGGGELGEKWHQDGIRHKKQNTIDDLIYATKWLHSSNYSSPSSTVLLGKSAGGTLVAAAMNQEPSLYRCVIPYVGLMDLLRYHKFGSADIWANSIGNPDIKDDFIWLIKLSPYHNISDVEHPAVLVITADKDDRVAALHSCKYAAELQRRLKNGSATGGPCLLKIIQDAGHGGSDTAAKQAEVASAILAFAALALGQPPSIKHI
ncbi:hypothetical protein INT43_007744 [Umbelopsis isabellina]|uniref:Prolyl endopeptidase n=1 Tax=Mortierella isabellina TaxID=91625 RepID=A0A8H7PNJ3_MORIS|nr:hypothetical protein INT43_007744 [Umbelopsis isabellina]